MARRLEVARSFGQRLKGLLFRRELSSGGGLLLEPCRSVHTCFMRFPIDVVFYNNEGAVVAVFPALTPFRFTPFIKLARGALELPAGTVMETGTRVGDLLRFTAA
ncbi:MAG: DUF192 domain-containing protein [Bacillota bacterium]